MRTPQYRKSAMAKRAEPIRKMLMQLLKEKIQRRDQKEALAKFMGSSVHYVHSMIYYGEGGLDAWINALIFSFDLKPHDLGNFLRTGTYRLKTKNREDLTFRRRWNRIGASLSEQERRHWSKILEAAITIRSTEEPS